MTLASLRSTAVISIGVAGMCVVAACAASGGSEGWHGGWGSGDGGGNGSGSGSGSGSGGSSTGSGGNSSGASSGGTSSSGASGSGGSGSGGGGSSSGATWDGGAWPPGPTHGSVMPGVQPSDCAPGAKYSCPGADPALWLPPCPSSPEGLYVVYQAGRDMYQMCSLDTAYAPTHVPYDTAIAAAAQAYADMLANGTASPNGAEHGQQNGRPYYDGTYGSYRAVVGIENPDDCSCYWEHCPGPDCGGADAGMVMRAISEFYMLGEEWRSMIVRMDGPKAMGIGHTETANHTHYWAMFFDCSGGCSM